MSRLARFTQKIFASAGLVGTLGFGGAAAGDTTTELATSSSLSTLQSLSRWVNGWSTATLGGTKFPAIEDMNALAYVTTSQIAYLLQQGIAEYDAGTTYFQKNVCMKAGTYQIYGSVTDNNIGNALTDAANWVFLLDLSSPTGFTTGDGKITLKTTADSGWVMADDGTIGSAASGGTTRANADTSALFALLWNNVSNTYAAVSGGRGGSAAADFAANKTIALTKQLGRAIAVAGTGATLSARVLGQTLGEETHVLITSELASHTHVATDSGHTHPMGAAINGAANTTASSGSTSPFFQEVGGTSNTGTGTANVTNANTGGDGAHNNMQPSTFWNVMIKL